MFKWAFKIDTGTTIEEGIEQPLANAGVNVSDKIIEHSALYKFEKVLLTELTPAGDIYRIGFGKNPYTGKDLSINDRSIEAIKLGGLYSFKKMLNINKLFRAEIATDLGETAYDLYEGGTSVNN